MSPDPDGDVARRAALSPLLRHEDFQPLSASVKVDIAAGTVAGQSRALNEDHYLVTRFGRTQDVMSTTLAFTDIPKHFEEYSYAMLVADGLGDAGRGGLAGRVALSTMAHIALHFGKWNVRVDPRVAAEILDRAEWLFQQADRAVVARSRTSPPLVGMVTTLTMAYSAGDDLFIASVGHSRAYLFRQGVLTQLSRDNTLEQHFADTAGPASVDPGVQDLHHILTDTIGGDHKGPAVGVEHYRLIDGDTILLCTNGLTDAVTDDQIADLLSGRRASAEQCDLLLDFARRGGPEDNATAIVAAYRVPEPRPAAAVDQS